MCVRMHACECKQRDERVLCVCMYIGLRVYVTAFIHLYIGMRAHYLVMDCMCTHDHIHTQYCTHMHTCMKMHHASIIIYHSSPMHVCRPSILFILVVRPCGMSHRHRLPCILSGKLQGLRSHTRIHAYPAWSRDIGCRCVAQGWRAGVWRSVHVR